MKAEHIFWPVLAAIVVGTEIANYFGKQETLTAYYQDGTRILYHADANSQTVAGFALGPKDEPLFFSSGVLPGCRVGDSANWSCPAVVSTDGAPVPEYGFLHAVDGKIGITKPKMQLIPIPWYRWEFRKVERFFGIKPAIDPQGQ